jgi:dTMP kinase
MNANVGVAAETVKVRMRALPIRHPPASPVTMRSTMLSSLFIVFDGPEGSGKSTQVKFLQQRLESTGQSVLVVRDPGTTRIGEQIRAILLDPAHTEMAMRCEMLLYMASRAQLISEKILPALASGKLVLCDRFVSSTLAYQLHGDSLSERDIRSVADVAIKQRWPDLTILFDLPVELSSSRVRPKFTLFPDDPDAGVEKDRIEQRPLDYHEKVRQNYLAQAAADPAHYRILDASRPPQVIHEELWSIFQTLR